MKPPHRTVDLRQVNYQVVLRHIYLNGPMSRLEISGHTDLSPSTVTNVTVEMLAEGVLIEKGMEESLGGRPRVILDINPDYGYLVGVDFGETTLGLEIFNLTRKKLGTAQTILPEGKNTPEMFARAISTELTNLIKETGIPREKILGVGIGVPGVVEHNDQVCVAAPMWGWKSVHLLEIIEQKIKLPAYIDNGAKAMALAESWFGAGRGIQDMVVILVSAGIGAGIITKGSLYRGATNSAGEWGHTKITLDGRSCRCGGHGCIEAYAGAPGIIASLHEFSKEPLPSEPEDQWLILTNLLHAYQKSDPLAARVLQFTAQVLGVGIANLINVFNPEKVVIGGWVGLLIADAIIPDLKRYVKEATLPISSTPIQIGLSQLGQDAVCTGAACLVLEEFLSLNQKFSRQV